MKRRILNTLVLLTVGLSGIGVSQDVLLVNQGQGVISVVRNESTTYGTIVKDVAGIKLVLPPSPIEYGDMVVAKVDVDKSKLPENLKALKYQWTVFETVPDKSDVKIKENFVVWPDGTQIVFPSGVKPKTFIVLLDVDCLFGTTKKVTVDGKEVEVYVDVAIDSSNLLTGRIQVGGTQPLPPDPDNPNPPAPTPDPVFPPGQFNLSKFSYDTINAQTGVSQHEKYLWAKAHVEACDGTLSKMAALPDNYKTVEAVIPEFKKLSDAKVAESGVNAAKFQSVKTKLEDEIYRLYTQTRTLRTAADFATAFKEISIGLREIKDAK